VLCFPEIERSFDEATVSFGTLGEGEFRGGFEGEHAAGVAEMQVEGLGDERDFYGVEFTADHAAMGLAAFDERAGVAGDDGCEMRDE